MKNLPHKTVERLSRYRRLLQELEKEGIHYIYSHDIAKMLHITPVQVRRDLMIIGYSGTLKKGYDIRELIDLITKIIDTDEGFKVAVIGLGNLGRAMIGYITGKQTKMSIVAAFDTNPDKVNKMYAGIPCYHIDKLGEIIKSDKISIAIITVPSEETKKVAEKLILSGIKGILNYTSTPINVPPDIYLEEYDMISSLEKVAYFVK